MSKPPTSFRALKGQPFSFTVPLRAASVFGVAEGPLGVACCGYDRAVRMFDPEGAPRWKAVLADGRAGTPYHLAFSPDGAHLAVSCDQTVFVVAAETGEVLARQRVVTSDVSPTFTWGPDGDPILWLSNSAMTRWTWASGANVDTAVTDRRWAGQRRWPRIVGPRVFFGVANTHGEVGAMTFDRQTGAHVATTLVSGTGQDAVPQLQPTPRGVVLWSPGAGPTPWDGSEPPALALGANDSGNGAVPVPAGLLVARDHDEGTRDLVLLTADGAEHTLLDHERFSLPAQRGPAPWVARMTEARAKPFGHILERIELAG